MSVMQLRSDNLIPNTRIADPYTFCVMDAQTHVRLAANQNPHLAWSGAPAGTQSFAIICHDSDVPSQGEDVNQEGREVPADLPRVDFFHWVLVDIPASVNSIAAASHANGVIPHGKSGPAAPQGMRHGINDYTGWFADDPNMRGDYFGYDGPCPPWNDSRIHHYTFTVFALDVVRLPVQGRFTGQDVRTAMHGHVLGQASLTVHYTLNPRLV